jgi:hypothetical protein
VIESVCKLLIRLVVLGDNHDLADNVRRIGDGACELISTSGHARRWCPICAEVSTQPSAAPAADGLFFPASNPPTAPTSI